MSIYPPSYGLSKYDLFWGKISRGEFLRRGASVANSSADLYICPSNKKAYIFTLFMAWRLAAGTSYRVYITDSSNNVYYIIYIYSSTDTAAIYDVIPLNPGDKLSVTASGTDSYGWIYALIVEV